MLVHLLTFQTTPFVFQKDTHYLLEGLIFNALVEIREKRGVRGNERVASHTEYTR